MTARATTTTLLEMVRLLARNESADLTDSQILSIATHEMHGSLVPAIAELGQEYFKYSDTVVSNGSQTSYTIHNRAVGNRIAAVYAVSSDTSYDYQLMTGYKSDLASRRVQGTGSTDKPAAYVHNNQLVLVPALTGGFSLVMDIYIRPGDLVAPGSAARQVVTVNAGSLVLDGASPVATGVAFDIVQNKSPFKHVAIDQAGSVSGSTITFTPPSGVAVGDWVCAADTSPIPQLPYETHPALVELTVGRVLGLLNDMQGLAAHQQAAKDIMQAVVPMLSPRVAEPPRKIMDGDFIEVPFGFYPLMTS